MQYQRDDVMGEINGDSVTTSGGTLRAAAGAQLIESSFSAAGRATIDSMALSGSGTFKLIQPADGGLTANLNCTLTSNANFLRAQLPPPSPSEIGTQWTRQLGPVGRAQYRSLAYDATGVYVAGRIDAALPGQTYAGVYDAFVRKYDFDGNELWTRQFGTSGDDQADKIAADATGVYVVGFTVGTLPDQTPSGGADAFVRKYNSVGTEVWTRQFGTSTGDYARTVAVNTAGVFIGGELSGDSFVRRLDVDGNELWTRQFVFPNAFASVSAVAVSAGGVYLAGKSTPIGGDTTTYVRRYDIGGTELWNRQIDPTIGNDVYHVNTDQSGVYVTGIQFLGVAEGNIGFFMKYDEAGNPLWTRRHTGFRSSFGRITITRDAIYVSGVGQTQFLRKYDADGNGLWELPFPNPLLGLAPNETALYGLGYRGTDLYMVKLGPPVLPEPPSVAEGGVLNAASFAAHPSPLAPGSIAAVFGSRLSDGSSVLSPRLEADGRIATALGGTTVTLDAIRAPIYYSTPGQLGIQIPAELGGQSSATLIVSVGGKNSEARTVFLSDVAPGIFTVDQNGSGPAAVLHEDNVTLVSAQRPAKTGEIVVIYCTGLGVVTPPLSTGVLSSGNRTVTTPLVTFDGIPAEVLFSGAAPGFAGVYQVNVRIPQAVRAGPNVALLLSIGGKESNSVTIAVAQ